MLVTGLDELPSSPPSRARVERSFSASCRHLRALVDCFHSRLAILYCILYFFLPLATPFLSVRLPVLYFAYSTIYPLLWYEIWTGPQIVSRSPTLAAARDASAARLVGVCPIMWQ